MTQTSTATETPAHMTRIGHGFYLTPSDAAMSREHMAAWFRARNYGISLAELDTLLDDAAGKTEAELDREYEGMHGSAA